MSAGGCERSQLLLRGHCSPIAWQPQQGTHACWVEQCHRCAATADRHIPRTHPCLPSISSLQVGITAGVEWTCVRYLVSVIK